MQVPRSLRILKVRQLIRNHSEEELKKSGFGNTESKGNVITDMTENLTAKQKTITTYNNIPRLVDDPDVREIPAFNRKR